MSQSRPIFRARRRPFAICRRTVAGERPRRAAACGTVIAENVHVCRHVDKGQSARARADFPAPLRRTDPTSRFCWSGTPGPSPRALSHGRTPSSTVRRWRTRRTVSTVGCPGGPRSARARARPRASDDLVRAVTVAGRESVDRSPTGRSRRWCLLSGTPSCVSIGKAYSSVMP